MNKFILIILGLTTIIVADVANEDFYIENLASDLLEKYRKDGLNDDHPIIIELEKIISGDANIIESDIERLLLENPGARITGDSSKTTEKYEGPDVVGVFVGARRLADGSVDENLILKMYEIISHPDLRNNIIAIFPNQKGLVMAIKPDNISEFAIRLSPRHGYTFMIGEFEQINRVHGSPIDPAIKYCEED